MPTFRATFKAVYNETSNGAYIEINPDSFLHIFSTYPKVK